MDFGPFEVGSVVARWRLDWETARFIEPEGRPAPLHPNVSLALEGKEGPLGHSGIMVLGRILEYVDDEVMPRLERFV